MESSFEEEEWGDGGGRNIYCLVPALSYNLKRLQLILYSKNHTFTYFLICANINKNLTSKIPKYKFQQQNELHKELLFKEKNACKQKQELF